MTELAHVPSPAQAGDGPAKGGTVRVLLYVREPEGKPEAVAEAYHQISGDLASTPGLLGNELLRSTMEDGAFVVLSYWADLAAFRSWEEGNSHRKTTSPLRPLQDRTSQHYGIYLLEAEY